MWSTSRTCLCLGLVILRSLGRAFKRDLGVIRTDTPAVVSNKRILINIMRDTVMPTNRRVLGHSAQVGSSAPHVSGKASTIMATRETEVTTCTCACELCMAICCIDDMYRYILVGMEIDYWHLKFY